MSFLEKSAWLMTFALLISGVLYFNTVMSTSEELGQLAVAHLPSMIIYTIILCLVSIIGHIVIAILSPKEASAKHDEREQKIVFKASHFSGYVTGTCIVSSLGLFLFHHDGSLLFYTVFGSLIISQLSEYLLQIFFCRTSFI